MHDTQKKPKHYEGLFKRKDSAYWFFDHTDANGKRVKKSTKETSVTRALLVREAWRKKASEHGVEAVAMKPPTLDQYSMEFLKWVDDSHSIKTATKRFYRGGVEMLRASALAGMRLDTIRNRECEVTTFPGGPYTANQALRTLRRMLSHAKEDRCIFCELPEITMRAVYGRSIAMTIEDAAAIAAKMRDGTPKDVFLVLRSTGMRPQECYTMRWEHVNWDAALFQNPKGKTRTARRGIPLMDIGLGNPLEIVKRRHIATGLPREGWIFPSARAESGHVVSIAKAFEKARDAAGLPKAMCLYCARHGFGTDAGPVLGLKATMELMGHAQAQTAMIYQHPNTEDIRTRLLAARTNTRIQ